MAISWTKHRFSGGLLVLDTTNTVVLRGDPRGFDRFENAGEIARFADAAAVFRAQELGGRPLVFEGDAANVMRLREAADGLFRSAAASGQMEARMLAALLRACAAPLEDSHERFGAAGSPFGDPSRPIAFEAALAVSALSLLAAETWKKVRICPNCNWLFLDRSRNASRLWCDMSVCGNRNKARRHYARHREAEADPVDA